MGAALSCIPEDRDDDPNSAKDDSLARPTRPAEKTAPHGRCSCGTPLMDDATICRRCWKNKSSRMGQESLQPPVVYSKNPEERKQQLPAWVQQKRHKMEKQEASMGSTEIVVSKPPAFRETEKPMFPPPPSKKDTPPPPSKKDTHSGPNTEQLMERLQDALDCRRFNEIEQVLREMEETDLKATQPQRELIKSAKQAVNKEKTRRAVKDQRNSARRERRWDPELEMLVNLDSMIDKYESQDDQRSHKELTAYYNTLKKKG